VIGNGPRLAPPRRLAAPGSHRPLALALLAVLAAALLAWRMLPTYPRKPPSALSGYAAAGARGPSCLRLVIAVDVSGSMSNYATARDDALAQLIAWVRVNLRADDQVAVVDFAQEAAVALAPTAAHAIGGARVSVPAADGPFTLIDPVLAALDGFPTTRCDTAAVLISDAQIADLPRTAAEGDALLVTHHIHDIRLLVPGAGIQVDPAWSVAFPAAPPRVFDGRNPDATGLALGQTIVDLTHQRLARS
jgi:Mg-chelatase subunit ChlD